MFLDRVEQGQGTVWEGAGRRGPGAMPRRNTVYSKWSDWQPSVISHHNQSCCNEAREWLARTDFSQIGAGSRLSGPRWLGERFCWGASTFPIFWCEAVRRSTLDCGALAALADDIFRTRGVRSFRVQMVQRFSSDATFQWANSWSDGKHALDWTDNDLIYHEACAAAIGPDEIKIWDPSSGWWVNAGGSDGYGSVLAIRVTGGDTDPKKLHWGQYSLLLGEWTMAGS